MMSDATVRVPPFRTTAPPPVPPRELPILAVDLPILYEDEGQEEMGESRPHSSAEAILRFALMAHFSQRPGHEVLSDMNLYYHPTDRWAYVSPDVMVVQPPSPLPAGLRSYRIGQNGPAPVLAVEVLSRRTAQQGDLTVKPELYADIGVSEYILIDPTGEILPERLLLKSLDPNDRTWFDRRDQGEGVVSRFGFRVAFDADDLPRVSDAATGWVYPRPEEADAAARAAQTAEEGRRAEEKARRAEEKARRAEEKARRAEEKARLEAEARVRELEAELARLRGQSSPPK